MKSDKHILFVAINIVLPLLLGLTVYYFLRPDTYVSQSLYRIFGTPHIDTAVTKNAFFAFVGSYLQDALWAYSLTALISFLLGQSKYMRLLSVTICVAFEITIELLQMFGIITGVFDIFDIVIMASATLLATLLFSIKFNKITEEKKK